MEIEWLSLMGFGFLVWYATGIDDALIFGGVMSQAKTLRQKWHATLGLLGAYVIMLLIVILAGSSFTLLLSGKIFGNSIKHIFLFVAILFVTKLGWDAWGEASETGENEESSDNGGKLGKVLGTMTVFFPKITQDAFRGFGLNCLDDITVNTANLLGKSGIEIFWYLLGNGIGLFTMILLVWLIHASIARFAETGGWWFHRLRALGIWFAAFLIYRSGMAA